MDERHIVAIDLGTSKFALTVAKIDGDNVQIVYYKKFDSDGVRYSRMYNPAKVSGKLKIAIADAEKELGLKITQAIVGLPKYEVRQESAQMNVDRNPDDCITYEEIQNLKSMAIDTYPLEDPEHEELLGAVAQSFSTGEDFQLVENDIIGMASKSIEGNFKLFVGKTSAIKNIDIAFNRTGICVARKYFTPESTAKAVLYESEMENGVALIDFGAGATSVSVYYGDIMRHYAAIPFGGKVISTDIKSEFSISEKLAENIKLAYGVCMPDRLQSLSEKTIQINSNNAAPIKQVPVKYLSEIITERMREIVEAILYEIQSSGFADHLKSGIVVTGGGANMVNCCNYINELSGYNVRIGYPKHLFSASGYEGIYDSDASVSVGMIATAKEEKNLNCALVTDGAIATQKADTQSVDAQQSTDGVTDTQQIGTQQSTEQQATDSADAQKVDAQQSAEHQVAESAGTQKVDAQQSADGVTDTQQTGAQQSTEQQAIDSAGTQQTGSLFRDDQLPPKEPKKKPAKNTTTVQWYKIVKDKVKGKLGNLYDDMNNENV